MKIAINNNCKFKLNWKIQEIQKKYQFSNLKFKCKF